MAACAAGKQPWLGGTCNIYFCRVRNFEEQTSRGQGWATKWDLSEDRQIASQEYRIAEVPEKGSWNVQVVCLGHHQLALHWIYYPCRVFSFHKTNWLQQLLQVSSLVRLNLPTDTFPSLVWFPACLTHPGPYLLCVPRALILSAIQVLLLWLCTCKYYFFFL